MSLTLWIILLILLLIFVAGIRIIRPTHRAVIETFGKYSRFGKPGFNWIIPIIQKLYQINVTEQMVDARKQDIITQDNLNASVDAQVYFRVKPEEEHVKNSQYKVKNVELQMVQLARTTLRDIIGNMPFKDANSKRNEINGKLMKELAEQTSHWGVNIVRAELKEIDAPKDVQDAMNQVVKAEKEKESAIDFATATETKADGQKRAEIKVAEGKAKAVILQANAKADAIKVVNRATEETFTDKAQILKKLETVHASLGHNAKIVLPEGKSLVNVVGDLAGISTSPKKGNKQVPVRYE